MKLLKYALLIGLGISIQDIAAMNALKAKQEQVKIHEGYGIEASLSKAFFNREQARIKEEVGLQNMLPIERDAVIWYELIESAKKEIDKTEKEIDQIKVARWEEERAGLQAKNSFFEKQIADKKKYMNAIADYMLNIYPKPVGAVITLDNAQTLDYLKKHLPAEGNK